MCFCVFLYFKLATACPSDAHKTSTMLLMLCKVLCPEAPTGEQTSRMCALQPGWRCCQRKLEPQSQSRLERWQMKTQWHSCFKRCSSEASIEFQKGTVLVHTHTQTQTHKHRHTHTQAETNPERRWLRAARRAIVSTTSARPSAAMSSTWYLFPMVSLQRSAVSGLAERETHRPCEEKKNVGTSMGNND